MLSSFFGDITTSISSNLSVIVSLILFSEFKIVSGDTLVSRVSVISMTSEPEILLETFKLSVDFMNSV